MGNEYDNKVSEEERWGALDREATIKFFEDCGIEKFCRVEGHYWFDKVNANGTWRSVFRTIKGVFNSDEQNDPNQTR